MVHESCFAGRGEAEVERETLGFDGCISVAPLRLRVKVKTM